MARPVRFGELVGKTDSVIEQFVRVKSRAAARLDIEIVRKDMPENATTNEALTILRDLAYETDATIVQLPLDDRFDTDAILGHIPAERDADAMNPRVGAWHHLVNAPVARAVAEILRRSHVGIDGAHTVVVGNGRLVGAPCAAHLASLGARVTTITLENGSLNALATADIIVLGAGSPGLVTPAMIKEGCAIIDAGTSEQGGSIKGDADPACAEKAAVFTPVPGGVGPVAVAMLFRNVLDLATRASEHTLRKPQI
jgi:methylenetetrahydrofolate dehydrogenase (NADP+)/methenyltetrahydrofolate cyclohydrolase